MNRATLTLATLAGIAGAYYALLGRAHLAEIRTLEQQFGDAYARFETADRESERTAELQACADELQRWCDDLRARVTLAPGAPPLIGVTSVLAGAGLTVERAEALPADSTLDLPHDRVRVVVAGAFPDLFEVMTEIENTSPPTRVTDLQIRSTPDDGALRCEMTIVRAWSALR